MATTRLEQHRVENLEVEQHQVKEVLRCLLHTIMFQRALGAVRPSDVESDLFDITYVKCSDPGVSKAIEDKVDTFSRLLEQSQPPRGQICLSFFEKHVKQVWFSKHEDRVYWEQWNIEVTVVPSIHGQEERRGVRPRLEQMILDRLTSILRLVNETHDHLPPVTDFGSTVCFPFEITVPQEPWNLGRRVSNMLGV